jgi:hypothetical protein
MLVLSVTTSPANSKDEKVFTLKDGDWVTEIRPGSILLRGPDDREILLEVGRVYRDPDLGMIRRMTPHLAVLGPTKGGTIHSSAGYLVCGERGAVVSVRSPIARSEPGDRLDRDPARDQAAAAILTADAKGNSHVTIKKKNKIVFERPVSTEER